MLSMSMKAAIECFDMLMSRAISSSPMIRLPQRAWLLICRITYDV